MLEFSQLWSIFITSEYEATNCWNESGQKWIEWECSNQTAVQELYDTGKHNVKQIGIDQLQFFWRVVDVFVVEFVKNCTQIGHFDSGTFLLCGWKNEWKCFRQPN